MAALSLTDPFRQAAQCRQMRLRWVVTDGAFNQNLLATGCEGLDANRRKGCTPRKRDEA